jgi:hypothetical protein
MPTEDDLETDQLAQMEADLAELSGHVDAWIKDRFLAGESVAGLNLEDVAGLITWLQQWHIHFDSYGDTVAALETAGRPAATLRLAQIRTEIDNSIATFTQMLANLLEERQG